MPKTVFKVALPGYQADVDTNPDHFSVYYDSTDAGENILIKEKERGSVTIAGGSSQTITHNLGYVPLVFVFGRLSGDRWSLLQGDSGELTASIELSTSILKIYNTGSSPKLFKYYIFYDKIL